jgi:ubiquinone biosynthesis protein UbiJ
MYQFLAPMLLNEVQKQQKTIDRLEQRLEALERQVAKNR